VPVNLRFPNRWLYPLWLAACCFVLPAQVRKVDPKKTITFEVPGATAAYGLDEFIAEATAGYPRPQELGVRARRQSGGMLAPMAFPAGHQGWCSNADAGDSRDRFQRPFKLAGHATRACGS